MDISLATWISRAVSQARGKEVSEMCLLGRKRRRASYARDKLLRYKTCVKKVAEKLRKSNVWKTVFPISLPAPLHARELFQKKKKKRRRRRCLEGESYQSQAAQERSVLKDALHRREPCRHVSSRVDICTCKMECGTTERVPAGFHVYLRACL